MNTIVDRAIIILNVGQEKEELLNILCENCKQDFLDYCNRTDVPTAAN